MGVAGALAGEPIRTAKCVSVDLEVPADSEIVIEGLIDTDLLEPEGPFGESHGYVALEDYNMSMQVTAITHRRSPVFVSIISQVTPSESSMIKKVAYEPMFLEHLREHNSIRSVRRVVMHEPLSNVRPIIFLQFANGAARTEVWRGLQAAAALRADCGKVVIAVSEDIDPSNTDAVLWSIAYRSNPQEDVHIEPYRSVGHAPKSGPRNLDSTMLIDATLKYPMPPLALPKREFMESALEIWKELRLPEVRLQQPWHGYSLGDWSEALDSIAANAVAGEWEKNGLDTFPRRRGGLTPETPVRSVEGAGASQTRRARDQAEARAEPAMRSVNNAAISRGHCTGVRCRAPGITVSLEFGYRFLQAARHGYRRGVIVFPHDHRHRHAKLRQRGAQIGVAHHFAAGLIGGYVVGEENLGCALGDVGVRLAEIFGQPAAELELGHGRQSAFGGFGAARFPILRGGRPVP